jgi:hypothetical protein
VRDPGGGYHGVGEAGLEPDGEPTAEVAPDERVSAGPVRE